MIGNGTSGGNGASGGNNASGGNANNPAVKVKVTRAKLVRNGRTRATVILRVTGPNGKVPVKLRFTARSKVAKGKKVMAVTRMVRTNRLVTIKGLRTPNAKRLALKVSLVS